mmetsp:Transcript_44827/g.57414  ORF Transcript_44827/g.57414 Transcript_44827/m.57414 type:complete len:137 (+) Transcript_44827:46-456(+)
MSIMFTKKLIRQIHLSNDLQRMSTWQHQFGVHPGYCYDQAGDEYAVFINPLSKTIKFPLVRGSRTGCDTYWVYQSKIIETTYASGTAELFPSPFTTKFRKCEDDILSFRCIDDELHTVPIENKQELTKCVEILNNP